LKNNSKNSRKIGCNSLRLTSIGEVKWINALYELLCLTHIPANSRSIPVRQNALEERGDAKMSILSPQMHFSNGRERGRGWGMG
jgi:hypothetical protein